MNLNGKKILITNCCGLGDLIMFTPILREIKKFFPTCKITFLCKNIHKEVLLRLPYVDKVVCIYRGKIFGRYRSIPDFFCQDIVIFTDWHTVPIFFAKIFKIPIRAGYFREDNFFTKFLNKELHGHVLKSPEYVAYTNAKIICDALEIKISGDMTEIEISQPTQENKKSVDKILNSIGLEKNCEYILLTPFTGFEQRNLPTETAKNFVEMIEKNFKIPVVISAPQEKFEVAKKISKYVLEVKTTIGEFTELVSRAKILVTPDSGPMHVAGALKKFCVAIFSKDLPSRWAPKKNCIPIYLNLPCSPCDDETAKNCEHLNCIKKISAQMVFDACKKFLEK